MSSTRRTILRGLAAAPVALAIPAAVLPATATASPDAALVAQAAAVEALAIRVYAALQKACELEDRADRIHPFSDRPKPMEKPSYWSTTRTDEPDGTIVYRQTRLPIDSASFLAYLENGRAIEQWNRDKDATARRIGHDAANRKHGRLERRLEAATRKLTDMAPTTMAGAIAKARAALAVNRFDDEGIILHDWEQAIRLAALRDMVTIGGAA